jgi:CRISPR-associated protein (TIGR02584 family)
LWALKQRNFNIQDVLVLHTQPKIKDLVESINLLNTAFDTDNRLLEYNYRLEPLLGDRGPIIDITSVVEAEQAANALFRVVKRFKLEHRRIHLYVAGGRKILAAYGMVVAQMLFDDEDKLWYSTSNEQLYQSHHMFPEPGDEFYLIDVPIIPAIRHLPLQTKLASAETIDQALQTEKTIRRQERLKQIDLFLNEVLTDAQRQIVLLMTQGLGNKEIAYQRKVERNTVDKQLSEVYKKWAKFWEIETAPHPRTQIITEVARYLSWREGRL